MVPAASPPLIGLPVIRSLIRTARESSVSIPVLDPFPKHLLPTGETGDTGAVPVVHRKVVTT
jgi:hypothetical protein